MAITNDVEFGWSLSKEKKRREGGAGGVWAGLGKSIYQFSEFLKLVKYF